MKGMKANLRTERHTANRISMKTNWPRNRLGPAFRSVYEFMLAVVDDFIGTYSNFRKYLVSRGIAPGKKDLAIRDFEIAPVLFTASSDKFLGEGFNIDVVIAEEFLYHDLRVQNNEDIRWIRSEPVQRQRLQACELEDPGAGNRLP